MDPKLTRKEIQILQNGTIEEIKTEIPKKRASRMCSNQRSIFHYLGKRKQGVQNCILFFQPTKEVLNKQDKFGNTLLHYLCGTDSSQSLVTEILSIMTNIHCFNKLGDTALTISVKRWVRAQNQNPNENRQTEANEAYQIVKLLLKKELIQI